MVIALPAHREKESILPDPRIRLTINAASSNTAIVAPSIRKTHPFLLGGSGKKIALSKQQTLTHATWAESGSPTRRATVRQKT
jgi:hypothetical protein